MTMRKLSLDSRWLSWILLAFMILCYGIILHKVGVHWPLNRTFNSMLDHLAHGRFDVDPNIVNDEGYLRNDGRVYAYCGHHLRPCQVATSPFPSDGSRRHGFGPACSLFVWLA